jgi:putative FmdB family regulatory protein
MVEGIRSQVMPDYLYKCNKCGKTWWDTQRITDPPHTECCYIDSDGPCVGGKVKRVIQPVSAIFKGSGFHVNDYPKS